MSYRDILVQVDQTSSAAGRVQLASALAKHWGAKLTGVFLKSDMLHNYMAIEGMTYLQPYLIDTVLKEQAEAIERAAGEAKAVFDAHTVALETEWQVIDGDTDEALVALARSVDLTVYPTWAQAKLGDHKVSAATLALGCGGPVLVAPASSSLSGEGDRVLVAWDGSREAARALRDAGPFLDRASEVRVLCVSPMGEPAPVGRLQRHCELRGWRVELIVDHAGDDRASEVLRAHVAKHRTDLLVMGLYGRSRLQEWILGGVSQDFLDAPPTTLLVSH